MSNSSRENDGGPPLFSDGVAAGFPSPAEGDIHVSLSLDDLCIRHPSATYFVRARGESMTGAGIDDGDILVVDRSTTARNGDIIIAAVGGEFTVKRLEKTPDGIRLLPENPAYPPVSVTPELGAEFFGVVTWVVKSMRK